MVYEEKRFERKKWNVAKKKLLSDLDFCSLDVKYVTANDKSLLLYQLIATIRAIIGLIQLQRSRHEILPQP